MTLPHILIVGSGSVGRRHARNLAQLGCRLSAMDILADRCQQLLGEIGQAGANAYTSLDAALADETFAGAVIASPPSLHVEQTLACQRLGLPILLEKPVSPALDQALHLFKAYQSSTTPLLLGYTWRWWQPLQQVRRMLADGVVGNLRHVRFVLSAHLADWHPWESYQDFFMAHKHLGGGALLDESHWIDLMLWFFGMPTSLYAKIDKLSDLEIDTDDNVDMVVTYNNGLVVTLHLDLFGRPHQKQIEFTGEKGTLRWTETPNEIAVSSDMAGGWKVVPFTCERNDMFLSLAREFLDVASGKTIPSCCLEDGIRVLQIVEAARASNQAGTTVQPMAFCP